MSEVIFENVEKSYADQLVVRGMNMAIRQGEFLTLLGPSGCGKTTCLRMIAGFVTPSHGRIIMAGRDITNLPPYRRNTGMVFQSYALFPHKTVAENIAFGLEVRRIPRAERAAKVAEALRLVRLESFADRYPTQLSGGQRQRVALARAVVIKPDVLLLDEPLAALDLKLREELQIEIRRVQTSLDITTLFVTHDQSEALSMSDRVAVMQDGRIVQIDSPDIVYERPRTRYVANFVGRTNLIKIVVRARQNDTYRVETCSGPVKAFDVIAGADSAMNIGDHCLLGTRPEHFHIGGGHTNSCEVTVRAVTYFGSIRHVEAVGPAGEQFTIVARAGDPIPARGETIGVAWRPEACFLLPE
jgi:putative spermidine/putrescine transport system ATP-binding protein